MTPADSQISLGVQHASDTTFTRLSYLAAGHDLDDDNRRYFTENALKLGFVSVLVSTDSMKLEALTLYEATSLTPSDPWLGGLSGHFHVGFRRTYDDALQRELNFDISGGLGKSFEPIRQVKLYSLLIGGTGASKTEAYGYIAPEAGMTFNARSNMKTHLKIRYSVNELNNRSDIWQVSISQMKFFSPNHSIRLRHDWLFNDHADTRLLQVDLKRYF